MTIIEGNLSSLAFGNNIIEELREFKYLGVTFVSQNYMCGEINIRSSAANSCYFAITKVFKSKLISKNTKEQL